MRKTIVLAVSGAVGAMLMVSCASVPVRVENPGNLFPETVPSNICYLRTVRSARLIGIRTGFNSAGTLVEGQYLVTAAHNLYDSWRTKLVHVQVSCKGSDGNMVTSLVDRKGIERTRKVSHYDRGFSTDYAFLKLDDPLPVAESITLNRSARISEIPVITAAGYPGGQLKYGSGRVLQPIPTDSTFYYKIDTAKGMSGGPVWATYQSTSSLVGIHVSEGRARAVDSDLINDFERWKSSVR